MSSGVRCGCRELDHDLGALATLAVYGDATSKSLDDVAGDRETESGPLRLRREERLEDVRKDVGRNPGAVVANLDAMGSPEIVVNVTHQDAGGFPNGRIQVLRGDTGGVLVAPIAHNPPTSYGSHGRSTIAVGDVSGDSLPDIIYAARSGSGGTARSLIVAIDRTGAKGATALHNAIYVALKEFGRPASEAGEGDAGDLAGFLGDERVGRWLGGMTTFQVSLIWAMPNSGGTGGSCWM